MVEPSKKEELFESIAPKPSGPMIITTRTEGGSGFSSKLAWFLVIVLAALSGYFFWQNAGLKASVGERDLAIEGGLPNKSAGDQGDSVVEKVGKLLSLPQNQQFSLLQVTDPEKYKSTYPDVSAGDYLLTFSTLELAYDPDRNIVLHVRNLKSLPEPAAQSSGSSAESRINQGAISLDIRNGAGVSGLAAATAETFKGVSGFEIKNIGNAVLGNYAKTVLVNMTGKNISSLERQFNSVAVSQVPQGEKASTADVLIIVGKN